MEPGDALLCLENMALEVGSLTALLLVVLIPGVGLVVRETGNSGRLQVFATPAALAMAAMSPHRVGWLVGVVRGVLLREGRRRGLHDAPTTAATTMMHL